jgi:hypothetical protein
LADELGIHYQKHRNHGNGPFRRQRTSSAPESSQVPSCHRPHLQSRRRGTSFLKVYKLFFISIFRAREIRDTLLNKDVRVYFDERDNYTPGWKFNNWELKGVPIRLELGPKDIEKNEVRLCKRNDNKKMQVINKLTF